MADKKITQLPSLSFISGSPSGYYADAVVLPIVHNGTTVKMEAQKFALYATQWSATTASNTFYGNQTVNGNVVITGNITAQEMHTEITSASIIFESGSTIFGNSADDTHTITGTININGKVLGNAPLDYTSQSLNTQTGSQESINTQISIVTGSIDAHILSISTQTGSQDLVNRRISSTTGSINTTTSSFNSEFGNIGSTTSSIHFTTQSLNTQTGSQDLVNRGISSVTGSINTTTSSFDSVFLGISSVTGAMNTQSSSQDVVNFNNSKVTASIDAHILGIAIYTASVISQTNTIATFTSSVNFATQSLNTQTGSQDLVNRRISSVTGSMNTQSSSQDSVNYQNSIVTSSFRNEIGGIEAYTASLKNAIIVNGSNVQIVGELDVARLNVQYVSSSVSYNSGSNIFGDASADKHEFSGSVNIQDTLFIKGQAIGTGELNAFTASQISKDGTLATVTSSFRAEIGGIEAYTASLKAQTIFSGSVQIPEIAGLEAYTASLKAQTIFSSSNQIFVNGAVISDNTSQKILGTSGNILYLYTGTSGLYINNSANNAQNVTITDAGVVTTRGGLQIGSSGNDQSLTFGGTNSSIYWGSGGPARMYYSTGDIRISSNGATDVLNVQNIGGVLVSGGITGSLMATNGVISGSQQIIDYNKFALTASANTFWGTQTFSGSVSISGSLNVYGNQSTIGNRYLTGSWYVSGSSTLVGNTVLSGSLLVTASSTFNNDVNVNGNFYKAGNKLFNYGQFFNTQTQSGSANTAYPLEYNTLDFADGVNITNNISGLPTRITVTNTGVYNLQFSSQLGTTATESCDFTIWLSKNGSDVANSAGQVGIIKDAGGGKALAAWNYMVQLSAGQYIELYYSKTTANGQIQYLGTQTTPTRPATASTIITITQVA